MPIPEKRKESPRRLSGPAPVAGRRPWLPRHESDFSRHGFAWLACFAVAMLVPVAGTVIRYVKLSTMSGPGAVRLRVPVQVWVDSGAAAAAVLTVLVIPSVLIADWHASLRGAKAWRDRLVAVGVACLLFVLFFSLVAFLEGGRPGMYRRQSILVPLGFGVAGITGLYHWLASREGKMAVARRAVIRCFRIGGSA